MNTASLDFSKEMSRIQENQASPARPSVPGNASFSRQRGLQFGRDYDIGWIFFTDRRGLLSDGIAWFERYAAEQVPSPKSQVQSQPTGEAGQNPTLDIGHQTLDSRIVTHTGICGGDGWVTVTALPSPSFPGGYTYTVVNQWDRYAQLWFITSTTGDEGTLGAAIDARYDYVCNTNPQCVCNGLPGGCQSGGEIVTINTCTASEYSATVGNTCAACLGDPHPTPVSVDLYTQTITMGGAQTGEPPFYSAPAAPWPPTGFLAFNSLYEAFYAAGIVTESSPPGQYYGQYQWTSTGFMAGYWTLVPASNPSATFAFPANIAGDLWMGSNACNDGPCIYGFSGYSPSGCLGAVPNPSHCYAGEEGLGNNTRVAMVGAIEGCGPFCQAVATIDFFGNLVGSPTCTDPVAANKYGNYFGVPATNTVISVWNCALAGGGTPPCDCGSICNGCCTDVEGGG